MKEQLFSQEQYEILLRCTSINNMDEWNFWRKENPTTPIHLNGALFPHCSLNGADLSEAYLQRADFSKCNLRNTNFFNAHLDGAILEGAMLSGANVNLASLRGANLRRANLDQCDFSRTDLKGAIMNKENVLKLDERHKKRTPITPSFLTDDTILVKDPIVFSIKGNPSLIRGELTQLDLWMLFESDLEKKMNTRGDTIHLENKSPNGNTPPCEVTAVFWGEDITATETEISFLWCGEAITKSFFLQTHADTLCENKLSIVSIFVNGFKIEELLFYLPVKKEKEMNILTIIPCAVKRVQQCAIIHAASDKYKLFARLEGVTLIAPQLSIRYGEGELTELFQESIRESNCVFLFCSSHLNSDQFVKESMNFSIENVSQNRILPVVESNYTIIPTRLKEQQNVSLKILHDDTLEKQFKERYGLDKTIQYSQEAASNKTIIDELMNHLVVYPQGTRVHENIHFLTEELIKPRNEWKRSLIEYTLSILDEVEELHTVVLEIRTFLKAL